MLSRLLVVLGLATLAVLPALGLSGCSSSKKRDVNYGTDAGFDFQLPDAAVFSSQPDANPTDVVRDTGSQVDGGSLDVQAALSATDLASDPGLQVDGGSLDTQAALGAADVDPDTGLQVVPADASAQESGLGVDS
jgi:hypothetical protein